MDPIWSPTSFLGLSTFKEAEAIYNGRNYFTGDKYDTFDNVVGGITIGVDLLTLGVLGGGAKWGGKDHQRSSSINL